MVEFELKMPQYLYDFAADRAAEAGITIEEYVLQLMEEEYARYISRNKSGRFRAQDYSYRVFWSEEDQAWIAVSPEFKYLSNIDEDSQLGAFSGMVDLLQSVLDDIYGEGKLPPAPFWTRQQPESTK